MPAIILDGYDTGQWSSCLFNNRCIDSRSEPLLFHNDSVIIRGVPMIGQSTGWNLEFYTTIRGESPVVDFLNSLSKTERAKVRNCMRLLGEFGTGLRMPHAKSVSGHTPLWELRPPGIRLLYFAHTGQRFIILHGFRKKCLRIEKRHIAVAERRMNEFLERDRDGD